MSTVSGSGSSDSPNPPKFSVWVDDAYLIHEAGQWRVSRWPYEQDGDPCFRCGHERDSHRHHGCCWTQPNPDGRAFVGACSCQRFADVQP